MPSGREIKAAIKKAATWGTAVVCGANDGVLLMADSLKRTIESHPDNSLGQPFIKSRSQGEIKAEGAVPAYLRYDSLDLLIALAMGATGGAPVQQATTAAYAQKFTLADKLDGKFGTVAVNKVVNIFEYPSVKIMGFTLKGEMGKPLDISFDCIPDNEEIASSVNTLATFANVTYFETFHRVLMSQGVFRMNNQSGAALASPTDDIKPSAFELSYKRKVKGDYVAGGGNKIIEPANDGEPEVTLKLTFPRYTETTYLTALGAETKKKADITFTGELIESTYYRQFKLTFPNLTLLNAEAATAEGQIVHPLEIACDATDTAPTGMTGILLPFQVDVINRKSTDVLA